MAIATPTGRDRGAAVYAGQAVAANAVQLALFTTVPSGATAGTEVSGGGYSRQTAAVTTPATGQRALAASFSLAANVAVQGWGLYLADGTYVDGGAVSSTSTSAGTLALTVTFTQN